MSMQSRDYDDTCDDCITSIIIITTLHAHRMLIFRMNTTMYSIDYTPKECMKHADVESRL